MVTSIVIPAHNEAATIGRLLGTLTQGASPGEFDVVVVCNGCTDSTAEIAAGFGPDVRVIEMPEPSKTAAQRRGDDTATGFPRAYVDADVTITADGLRRLVTALNRPPVLACSPLRRFEESDIHPIVRWYYEVWERLPQVRSGLFGRGVIMVSEAGHHRISGLPLLMSDDLAMSEAFSPQERAVVEGAEVVIVPPRTVRDLVLRRIRVATGNAQAKQAGVQSEAARTSVRDLLEMVRHEPAIAMRLPVFIAVTLGARSASRRRISRGDYTTWLRDESSRRPPPLK